MSPASIGVNLRVTGHCSQGGRKYMEDFFSVAYQQSEDEKDLEYAYFGIYDGHGGSEAATYAKEHLMNSIVNQKLFWSDCDQDILRAIREGYIATHYAMWREQEKWPKTATGLPSTAGTTASVAFIRRGKIYIGHVGDSGIVLGYQEEGEKFWRAKPLTHDHKPECNVEKARIINSGGKVVTKSGVPRVVWNRPRIGHKGPVRRSTPIDEIPFLAVARSLGDLWSYNSALNEFVVSPDPDVRVIKIDPKTYRCLIFGTDGLWNVLSPSDAVELARDTEIINEKLLYMEGGRTSSSSSTTEWTNPSKCLVDKALERWCSKKMRADNTSVVTIMLDPPGPPKKDIITRNYSTASYGLEYIQLDGFNDDTLIGNIEYNSDNSNSNILMDNYPILDNSTVAMYDDHSILGNGHTSLSSSSSSSALTDSYNTFPTNGYAIMTSYENNCNDDNTRLSIENDEEEEDANIHEYHSYHSLDESGIIGQDHIVQHHQSHTMNQQQQHQYQQQCMSAEEGYSLTKLETRCEQQFRQQQQHLSPSAFHQYNNQYDNITSSYNQQTITPSTVSLNSTINNQHSRHNEYYNNNRENSNLITITPNNSVIQQNNNGNSSSSNSNTSQNNKYEKDNNDDKMTTSSNDKKSNEQNLDLLKTTELKVDNKNYEYTNIDNSTMEIDEDEETNKNISNKINLDESIQINEISSSVIEPVTIEVCIDNNEKLIISNDEPSSSSSSIIEIDETHRTLRTRRSIKQLYNNQNHQSNKNTKINNNNNRTKSTNKILIEQNENISLIFEPRKLRSTVINCNNKRNLRSRDTTTTTTVASSSNLSKDMKIKPLVTHKKQQQQNTKRNLNNYLKVSNSSPLVTITPSSTIRTRQFQQQITLQEIQQQQQQQQQQQRSQDISTVWSPRQKRLKNNSPILRRTAADSSFKSLTNKNKPKIISSYIGSSTSSVSSSSTSSLIVSSSTLLSSKRSSNLRNQSSSAWCSNNNNNNNNKSAVQTRNRVQKRLSH